MAKTETTTTAYAPYSGKEGQYGNGDDLTTALVLDLLLSFGVLDDGVLALLDQLEVGRVAVSGDQLENDGNGTTAVNFQRHDDNNDALTALGYKRSNHRSLEPAPWYNERPQQHSDDACGNLGRRKCLLKERQRRKDGQRCHNALTITM